MVYMYLVDQNLIMFFSPLFCQTTNEIYLNELISFFFPIRKTFSNRDSTSPVEVLQSLFSNHFAPLESENVGSRNSIIKKNKVQFVALTIKIELISSSILCI